jgi:hypothetical protein
MYSNVPHYIQSMLQGEPVDFIVQSAQDLGKKRLGYVMLLFLIPFTGIFLMPVIFMIPVLEMISTGRTTITVNGAQQIYTGSNFLIPVLFALTPLVFSLLFIIPMIGVFLKAIRLIRKKGPWYAGTNNNLIEIADTNAKYYNWKDFENQISSKNYNDSFMDIILKLKQNATLYAQFNPIPLLQNNTNASVTGKNIDITSFLDKISISNNQIGLLRIPNGSYVFNLIRHNMERYSNT